MKMTTGDRTELIRSAFEAMVPEFGTPSRTSIRYRDSGDSTLIVAMSDDPSNDEIHPIFGLSHHYRSHDNYEKGYTANPYRGDHIGIDQEIAIFETSFHKGQAFIDVVTFPSADRDSSLYSAALALLNAEETR
jgi:hypothetical protein